MGSAIPISGTLPPLVEDIGSLIGLLVSNGTEFDFSWFGDVPTQIEAIPGRRAEQWKLLTDLLGTPARTIAGRNWYALPFDGGASPIYLVLAPHAAGGGGVIGVGLYDAWAGTGSATATLFAPLADTAGSPIIVAGSAGSPIELVASATLSASAPAGGHAFGAVELTGLFPLDGSAPSYSLTFSGGATPPPAVTSLVQLLEAGPNAWANAALGTPTVIGWLARKLGGAPITVGDLFTVSGLLDESNGTYTLANLTDWVKMGAVGIGELILSNVLKRLAALTAPIVSLGDGGISVFANAQADNSTDYGLRLCIADVALATADGTAFVLQLGKMLDADSASSSWVTRCNPPAGAITDPGVSLTLLNESPASPPVPSFKLGLDLVSIGLDLDGASGNPLLDLMGVTLGSAQPRFLFSCDLHTVPIYWGIAIQADNLGIPLGNGLTGSGAASNPVAQNLLSSGSAGGGGDKEAVNPAFSASIAGMSHPGGPVTLDVQLHSNLGPGSQVWVPVQRAFGPLHCQRVGLEWPSPNPNNQLDILFDGSVDMSVLDIDLQGLSIGIPLTAPGDLSGYSLDLKGLGISCDAGPVSITGAFLESSGVTPVTYDGYAQIQAASWTISAEGSYASLNGDPSLFIFAQLGAELGGPPFFFVTGLCAGFGYNRSLRLPTQDEVPDFPLLAAITTPGVIPPGADPMTALSKLDSWISPAQGVNWIAAGVQFTSFDLVQSNVVVTAEMGNDFQAAILGVSRIKLAQTGPQFAYAELGISVVIRPSDGFFGVSAQLSPNSYLLTQDCHLTGGFAFWIWYDGEHAGDFVITLGGYHPAFVPPPHYPVEPRLGFSWQVSDNLTVQGDSYFALTPSCAMGGGSLQVLFHDGNLRAWFDAYADFLFTWKPFYFVGDVGVDIGASYKLDLLFTSVTVSVSLGADLTIWGPPTGGTVHVDWYIISFTVGFGADQVQPATSFQPWDEFKTLIPKRPASGSVSAHKMLGAADPSDSLGMLTLSMTDGLLGTSSGTWLVRADSMTFAVATPIPATSAAMGSASYTTTGPGATVGVRPMGVTTMTSGLAITMTGPDGPVDLSAWSWTPTTKAAPGALWGAPLSTDPAATPTVPTADSIAGCLHGFTGINPPDVALTGPAAFPLADLDYYEIDDGASHWLPLVAADPPAPAAPQPSPPPAPPPVAPGQGSTLQQIAGSIASASVVQRRAGIFAALQGFGYDPVTNGDTSAIAANVNLSYPDEPMLGAPWGAAA